jgi:uncharacterized protein
MTRTPPAIIAIFARAPVAGTVKTRLHPAIGPDNAARLARAFLADTWRTLRSVSGARQVVTGTGDLDELRRVVGAEAEIWPQGEGHLGQRLAHFFTRALRESRTAIAIGADSPGLPVQRLEEAIAALSDRASVIGPADDGGFYLLGLRRFSPALLDDLPWSTDRTCAAVIERLCSVGLPPGLLAPWFDVDRPDDLRRLCVLIDSGQVVAPATAAAVATMF